MRFSAAAILFLACHAFAQDAPLTVTGGDAKTVEVERQVIVKDKLTQTTSFPFTISAPKGGNLYIWHVPDGATANKKADTLEITAAPQGKLLVSVSWIVIDFKAMATVEKSASITVIIGSLTPPDPLTDAFQVLYAADAGMSKAGDLAALIQVYRGAAYLLGTQTTFTAGEFFAAAKKLADGKIPADSLKALRAKIGTTIAAALPDDPDAPLDDATRKAAAALYGRVATCLEAVK